jgi:dienelactone hydrolase
MLAVGLLLNILTPMVDAWELVTMEARRGVSTKMIVEIPEKPVAVALMLAGGFGTLELGTSLGRPFVGNKGYEQVFNVRTRNDFVKRGLAVGVIDAPADLPKGMTPLFRLSKEHRLDVDAAINHLKQKVGVPVWLIGTSMGTVSAASVALDNPLIGGIALTASITRMNQKFPAVYRSHPRAIVSLPLEKIKVPVFIAAHKDDGCEYSPAADTAELAARFSAAPKVQTQIFDGGLAPRTGPCEPLAPHGFFGIEDKVIDAIVTFIKGYSK